MKNITILAIGAALVAVFAYYTIFSGPVNQTASDTVVVQDELTSELAQVDEVSELKQGTGSLQYLRQLGDDLECTISYTDPEQQSAVEGTYFVSDGDMRGDFLTRSSDLSDEILSSMIISGNDVHVWSEVDGGMYGMKMTVEAVESAEVDPKGPVPLDTNVQYDCKAWDNVDRTVFEPPSNVLFQDMDQLMQAGMEYGNVYNAGMEFPGQ